MASDHRKTTTAFCEMISDFHAWDKIKDCDLDNTLDMILTGRDSRTAMPEAWLMPFIPLNTKRLLDFGCGVGRNTFYFAKTLPDTEVIGYDNDVMLGKCQEFYDLRYGGEYPPNLIFSSDWEGLKVKPFDVVMCCFVLQHVFESELIEYIRDFKSIARRLVVVGRRVNDDQKKTTWALLEKYGLVPTRFYNSGVNEVPYDAEGISEAHHTAVYDICI
jgi:2-polyprenyl-3-methyl-5-hydroxy-6-metoxy-1,4-benzoquinol methylase